MIAAVKRLWDDYCGTGIRTRWFEVAMYKSAWFGFGYSVYHDTASWFIHLPVFSLFIKSRVLIPIRPRTEDWDAQYGFTFHDRALHLNWRTRNKVLFLPWSYEWCYTEVLDYSGRVVWRESRSDRKERPAMVCHDGLDDFTVRAEIQKRVSRVFPYVYRLSSGEEQHREARVSVERRAWGYRWFPFPLFVRNSIDVEFSDEVGERTGSWKGGCLGCGYDMKKGETPEECLRRMERERIFK